MENTYEVNLEKFLRSCNQYRVLHEQGRNNKNIEHFFIAVTVNDVTDSTIKNTLINYMKKYPLIDISEASQKYIDSKREEFYFIHIDSLDKNDVFFIENEKFLRKNLSNILSLKIHGETVDIVSHIEHTSSKYFSQFKDLSMAAGSLLKDEIKNGINFAKNKKPLITEKITNLKRRIKN